MRVVLGLLQATGALSLIPWPAIAVASVMSLAATRPAGAPRFTPISILFILVTLYPLVWIGLYAVSWRAIAQGAVTRAFVLSSIPVLASLAALLFLFLGARGAQQSELARIGEARRSVEQVNPLVWTILCAGGPGRCPGGAPVSVGDALAAIQRSDRINDPAPPYGTPLRTALWNLNFEYSGSPRDERQLELVRLVRALVARGARFSTEEHTVLRNGWLLRLAMWREPVTTAAENPLVWRIVNGKVLILEAGDRPFLNAATRLHGTPLYAALLTNRQALASDLVEAGGRLAADEGRDAGASAALEELFSRLPHLRAAYRRSTRDQ